MMGMYKIRDIYIFYGFRERHFDVKLVACRLSGENGMEKDNRSIRQDIFANYKKIIADKRYTTKEVSELSGISRNTFAEAIFINDTPMYLTTFLKLCIGLDVMPSALLASPDESDKPLEEKELLEKLDEKELRSVLMHAISYLEARR